jgi:hypothetical protein
LSVVPCAGRHEATDLSIRAPAQLKLELVHTARPLVLDVEGYVGWQAQAFAAHLNCEWCSDLEGIGETPKLGHELWPRSSLRVSVNPTRITCGEETCLWRGAPH